MLASMLRLALAISIAGCGAPSVDAPIEDVRAASDELPASDRDPLHYTPPATTAGGTDVAVALAASGGEDQARQMLPTLLNALRDADQAALERIFADEVATVRRSDQRGQQRSTLIDRILAYARRQAIPPDLDVDHLVDLANVRVTRAGQFWQGRPMPGLVRPTDLVVEVPLLPEGRGALRALLGWDMRGHLVVRPGRDPRIVAM